MSIDLNKITTQAIKELNEDNRLEKKLQKTITDVIEKVCLDLITSWGFKQKIEKKLELELNGLVDKIQIDGYNTMILNTFSEFTQQEITYEKVEKIKQKFFETFFKKYESYKLSDIITEYRKSITPSEEECICDPPDYNNFELEIRPIGDNDIKNPSLNIELYTKSKKYSSKQNKLKINIYRSKKQSSIMSLATNDIDISRNSICIKPFNQIEKLLVNLFYNETQIECDIDHTNYTDIDTTIQLDYD